MNMPFELGVETAAGPAIWYANNDCWAHIRDRLIERGYSEDETSEIPYREYTDLVGEWINAM